MRLSKNTACSPNRFQNHQGALSRNGLPQALSATAFSIFTPIAPQSWTKSLMVQWWILGVSYLIISSHILPEIEVTCDRVLIINGGRIVAQGTPAELRRAVVGRTHYELELAGDLGALPAVLADVSAELTVQATAGPDDAGFHAVTLTTTNDHELGERLLQALTAHAYRVRAVSRAHPTLEDVFLAATKRSWDIVDAPSTRHRQSRRQRPDRP